MVRNARTSAANNSTANLGFEAELWATDTLRGNIESAEYKHVVLGLLFLKHVSDAFEERHAELVKEAEADPGVDTEDRDEYLARNVFWLPRTARWAYLRDRARTPEIGKVIDEAMLAVESANPRPRGVLPRDYARPALDKARFGQLVDRFSNLGLGGKEHQAKDTLGRVYEYFVGGFALAEGRRGGSPTPRERRGRLFSERNAV
jgi:type I restriction enzyme M protein